MKYLAGFLLLSSLLLGITPSIEDMINEIKNAPASERYIKMNAFKAHLKTLNRETRIQAIAQMRTSNTSNATQIRHPIVGPYGATVPQQNRALAPNKLLQKSIKTPKTPSPKRRLF